GMSTPNTLFPNCQIYVVQKNSHKKKRLSAFFKNVIELKKILQKSSNQNRNNEVYIHFNVLFSAMLLFLLPITWSQKRICTFHGSVSSEIRSNQVQSDGFKKWIKIKLFYLFQLFILNNVHKVIVLSDYSKQIILKQYSAKLMSKIILIPGFLDTQAATGLKK